ncbi:hypothetical protein MP638_003534 [Amoeboaphelidium occidentale]|nr:hypothetical protein MP638_003534 [Amoeboaphelidium occidentale]
MKIILIVSTLLSLTTFAAPDANGAAPCSGSARKTSALPDLSTHIPSPPAVTYMTPLPPVGPTTTVSISYPAQETTLVPPVPPTQTSSTPPPQPTSSTLSRPETSTVVPPPPPMTTSPPHVPPPPPRMPPPPPPRPPSPRRPPPPPPQPRRGYGNGGGRGS